MRKIDTGPHTPSLYSVLHCNKELDECDGDCRKITDGFFPNLNLIWMIGVLGSHLHTCYQWYIHLDCLMADSDSGTLWYRYMDGTQTTGQGWPHLQSHWITTIDMNIWMGNQPAVARLTPPTVSLTHYNWHECMDQQSDHSKRLTRGQFHEVLNLKQFYWTRKAHRNR